MTFKKFIYSIEMGMLNGNDTFKHYMQHKIFKDCLFLQMQSKPLKMGCELFCKTETKNKTQ